MRQVSIVTKILLASSFLLTFPFCCGRLGNKTDHTDKRVAMNFVSSTSSVGRLAQSDVANAEQIQMPPIRDTRDLSEFPMSPPPLSHVDHPNFKEVPVRFEHIVGGSTVTHGAFPFFVDFGPCGATLVHADIVATAAHCNVITIPTVSINAYYSPHGKEFPFGSVNEGDTEKRSIIARRIHPDYNNKAYMGNDIMLLKLNLPSKYAPVSINSDARHPVVHEDVIALGHGVVNTTSRESSPLLQRVSLTTYSNEECHSIYSNVGHSNVIQDSMLCTGTVEGGRDSCQGDSGGGILERRSPSVRPGMEQSNEFVLVGIVSFGVGCALADMPAVNTRVSAYSKWIQQQICDLSENPPRACPPVPENTVSVRVNVVLDSKFERTSWSIRRREDNQVVFFSQGHAPGLTSERVYLAPDTYLFAMNKPQGEEITTSYELVANLGEMDRVLVSGPDGMSEVAPQSFIVTLPPRKNIDELTEGTAEHGNACRDAEGEEFYVSKLMDAQNCAWLKSNRGWRRILCQPGSRVHDLCPDTCGKCSRSDMGEPVDSITCSDSWTATFLVEGRGRYDCQWLSKRHEDTIVRLCQPPTGLAIRGVCPKSCNACDEDNVRREFFPRDYNRRTTSERMNRVIHRNGH